MRTHLPGGRGDGTYSNMAESRKPDFSRKEEKKYMCQKSKKNFRKQLGGVKILQQNDLKKKKKQEQKLCNLIL